jgi:hypothetical protein
MSQKSTLLFTKISEFGGGMAASKAVKIFRIRIKAESIFGLAAFPSVLLR